MPRGAVVARPVHTREVAGANPAAATNPETRWTIPFCPICGYERVEWCVCDPRPRLHSPDFFSAKDICPRCGHVADGHIHLSRAKSGVPKEERHGWPLPVHGEQGCCLTHEEERRAEGYDPDCEGCNAALRTGRQPPSCEAHRSDGPKESLFAAGRGFEDVVQP